MNIDFHVHSKITSNFNFDSDYIAEYIKEGKAVGLDAFAISEHCHAKNFEDAYRYIDSNYEKKGDCYDVGGMKVFTGIEVTTLERFDVVVISDIDRIFELKRKIDKIISNDGYTFIPINKLVDIIRIDNSIVILAHPYRRFDIFPEVDADVFKKMDAVEINATDLFKFGINEMKVRVENLGNEINKNITEGSDAHHPLQIGSVSTKILGQFDNVLELKNEIIRGNVEFCIAKEFRTKVQGARLIKKLLCGKA